MAAVGACPGSSDKLPALRWLSPGQEEVPEEEGGGRGWSGLTWKQVLPPSLSRMRPPNPLGVLFFPHRYTKPSVTAARVSPQGSRAGCSLPRGCPWLYYPKPVRLWLEPNPKSYSPLSLVRLVSTVRHEEFSFIKQNTSA